MINDVDWKDRCTEDELVLVDKSFIQVKLCKVFFLKSRTRANFFLGVDKK